MAEMAASPPRRSPYLYGPKKWNKGAVVVAAIFPFAALTAGWLIYNADDFTNPLPASRVAKQVRIPVRKIQTRTRTKDYELGASHIPMYDQMDTSYWSDITIGGQSFTCQFDTGSSNVWVPDIKCNGEDGKSCDGEGPDGVHKRYNASESKTYEDLDQYIKLAYGTGKANGHVGKDVMTVGDLEVNQVFMHADFMDESMASDPYDGLVGLGLVGILTGPGPTWLQSLEDAEALPMNTFTFEMSTTGKTGKSSKGGELVFGEPSDPNLVWLDVVPVHGRGLSFWQVEIDSYQIGPDEYFPQHTPVVIDSGTSCLLLPTAAYHSLTEQLKTDPQNPQVPCDQNDLPVLTFNFGGKAFEITHDYYLISLGDEPGAGHDRNDCFVCVQDGGDEMLLGDVFHRKYNVTYDFGETRLGFPDTSASRYEGFLQKVSQSMPHPEYTKADGTTVEISPMEILAGASLLMMLASIPLYRAGVFTRRERRARIVIDPLPLVRAA